MHALQGLQEVDEHGAHVQAHVAAVQEPGRGLPGAHVVTSLVVAPGPELLHEPRGVPPTLLHRTHQAGIRKHLGRVPHPLRRNHVRSGLHGLDAHDRRQDLLAPQVHRVLVVIRHQGLGLELALHQVEPVVAPHRPRRLGDLLERAGRHGHTAGLHRPQRARIPGTCGDLPVRVQILDDRTDGGVALHILHEHGVIAGSARHILASRNVGRNPQDAVHALLVYLTHDPLLLSADQLVHRAGAPEVTGDTLQVRRAPRNGGHPGTEHRPAARPPHLPTVLVHRLTGVGVELNAPAVLVVGLNGVAGAVEGVGVRLPHRVNQHPFDVRRSRAPLDLATGSALRSPDQLARELVIQQASDLLPGPAKDHAGLGDEPSLLHALELPTGQTQQLLVIHHEATPIGVSLLVAGHQHLAELVHLVLGCLERPEPELAFHRIKRSAVPHQPPAVHFADNSLGSALKDARHVQASTLAVHRPAPSGSPRAGTETDLAQPPGLHRLEHRLAATQAGHHLQHFTVLLVVGVQRLVQGHLPTTLEDPLQLIEHLGLDIHRPSLATPTLDAGHTHGVPGHPHPAHDTLSAVLIPAQALHLQPVPDLVQILRHRGGRRVLRLEPRHRHAVLAAQQVKQPLRLAVHDQPQPLPGVIHVLCSPLAERRCPAPDALRLTAGQVHGPQQRELGGCIRTEPGIGSEEPAAPRYVAYRWGPTRRSESAQDDEGIRQDIQSQVGDRVPAKLILHPIHEHRAFAGAQGGRINKNAPHRVGGRDPICQLGQNDFWLVVQPDRVKHPSPHFMRERNLIVTDPCNWLAFTFVTRLIQLPAGTKLLSGLMVVVTVPSAAALAAAD